MDYEMFYVDSTGFIDHSIR